MEGRAAGARAPREVIVSRGRRVWGGSSDCRAYKHAHDKSPWARGQDPRRIYLTSSRRAPAPCCRARRATALSLPLAQLQPTASQRARQRGARTHAHSRPPPQRPMGALLGCYSAALHALLLLLQSSASLSCADAGPAVCTPSCASTHDLHARHVSGGRHRVLSSPQPCTRPRQAPPLRSPCK